MAIIKKTLNITFQEALVRVQNALKEQGFGIIAEINVKETFKTKLNVAHPKYEILGARANARMTPTGVGINYYAMIQI